MPTDSGNLQHKSLLQTRHSSHGCPRIPAIYNTKASSRPHTQATDAHGFLQFTIQKPPPDHTLKPRMPTDSCNLQYKSLLQTTHSSHGCPRTPAIYNPKASSRPHTQATNAHGFL